MSENNKTKSQQPSFSNIENLQQFNTYNEKMRIVSIVFWTSMTLLLIGLTIYGLKELWVDMDKELYGQLDIKKYAEDKNSWVKASYGPIAMYPLFITTGMLLSIGFSAWKFHKAKLDLVHLSLGAMIIVPVSLMGASFFGKLNANGPGNHAGSGILIDFWEGGMSIHGGVYAGLIVGLIIFYFVGRKTKVSMTVYGDAIIPNILLGQAIGRWGNFFNHELAGKPIFNYSTNQGSKGGMWMPQWILDNVTAKYTGTKPIEINGIIINPENEIQMAPIFFYEAMGLLAAWVLITFIIPNVTKWISKKPWKIHPDKYKIDWNFTWKQFFCPWLKSNEQRLSYRDAWDQAYYKNSNIDIQDEVKQTLSEIVLPPSKTNWDNLKRTTNPSQIKDNMINWQKGSTSTLPQYITQVNNPDGYTITKSGVEMYAYFFFWNFVRFFLELERSEDHLFIMYKKELSLGIIIASFVIGFIGILICQFIMPRYFRHPGYQYEKQYFKVGQKIS